MVFCPQVCLVPVETKRQVGAPETGVSYSCKHQAGTGN